MKGATKNLIDTNFFDNNVFERFECSDHSASSLPSDELTVLKEALIRNNCVFVDFDDDEAFLGQLSQDGEQHHRLLFFISNSQLRSSSYREAFFRSIHDCIRRYYPAARCGAAYKAVYIIVPFKKYIIVPFKNVDIDPKRENQIEKAIRKSLLHVEGSFFEVSSGRVQYLNILKPEACFRFLASKSDEQPPRVIEPLKRHPIKKSVVLASEESLVNISLTRAQKAFAMMFISIILYIYLSKERGEALKVISGMVAMLLVLFVSVEYCWQNTVPIISGIFADAKIEAKKTQERLFSIVEGLAQKVGDNLDQLVILQQKIGTTFTSFTAVLEGIEGHSELLSSDLHNLIAGIDTLVNVNLADLLETANEEVKRTGEVRDETAQVIQEAIKDLNLRSSMFLLNLQNETSNLSSNLSEAQRNGISHLRSLADRYLKDFASIADKGVNGFVAAAHAGKLAPKVEKGAVNASVDTKVKFCSLM